MKKTAKKLVLTKETLRSLETDELSEVMGAYSEYCPSVYFVCKIATLEC
jgi:hypothetical protein